jgi:hypothetical protein
MKRTKLLKYNTTILWEIIIPSVIFIMTVLLILFPLQLWPLLIPLSIIILCEWYLIKTGFFRPIYYTEDELQYRHFSYKWQDIKITAYPALHKSYQYGYYLVFGEQYLYKDELKSQIRKGFYVYLREKSIGEILKNYKRKILILDVLGKNEDELKTNQYIKSIINMHNKHFQ